MSKFGFGKVADNLKPAIKSAAIEIMRTTKGYFDEAFEKEQLGSNAWVEVARRTPGTPYHEKQVVKGINKASGKMFKVDQGTDWQTRRILSGTTGRLRYKTVKADSSITNWGAVSVMINPVKYSGYINDGTPYMPARPFMKQTDTLTFIQIYILQTKTNLIWKVAP